MTSESRFWSYVDKTGGADACWPWTGSRQKKGYGTFFVSAERGVVRTSRYAFELATGRVPSQWVLHSCDNPSCVNPAHLREGDAKDNARDRDSRGRRQPLRGEAHPAARLTEVLVRDIRVRYRSGERVSAIARSVGVARSAVREAAIGTKWKHVEEYL